MRTSSLNLVCYHQNLQVSLRRCLYGYSKRPHPLCPAIKNPYGHILGTVKPCRPEANEPAFVVEAKDRAAAVPSLPESLDPPPYTSDPPSGYSYPHSPHWNLDRNDTHYRSNVCYAANVSSEYGHIEREFQEQSSLTNPPGVDPTFDGERGVYVDGAPEGMVKMVAGIPMRLDIDGGKKGTKTYACHHTLASIQTMYPDIYDEVLEISQELRLCVFGRAPSTPKGKDGVRPLYTYEFMRQNHRSQKRGQATRVEAGISENYNGSYSLASTIAEGNALGTLVPALQVGYDAARDQIKKVLTLLRRLYLLLGPRSMTKFEWEVVQFHLDDNNVFSFTGLKHGGIAVQFNLSCGLSGGDLMRYIGRLQGTWHVDAKDALAILGMFVLMLRLPASTYVSLALFGVSLTSLFQMRTKEVFYLVATAVTFGKQGSGLCSCSSMVVICTLAATFRLMALPRTRSFSRIWQRCPLNGRRPESRTGQDLLSTSLLRPFTALEGFQSLPPPSSPIMDP